MMISTIALTAVKGRTANYDLEQFTVITGRNAAGKTTLLDAIRIGLLGYHPALGKRAGDTFKLASAPAMGVRLEFSGDRFISRSWVQKGKGVRATTEASSEDFQGLCERTGQGLDVSRFLAGTGRERIALVAAAGGTDAAKALRDRAAAFLGSDNGDWSDPFQRAEELAEELKRAVSDAKVERDRWTKTTEGLTISDAEAAIATVDPKEIESTRKELSLKRTALGAARERARNLDRLQHAAQDAQAALAAKGLSDDDLKIEDRYQAAVERLHNAGKVLREAEREHREARAAEEKVAAEEKRLVAAIDVWKRDGYLSDDGNVSVAHLASEIDAISEAPDPDVDACVKRAREATKERQRWADEIARAAALLDAAKKARDGFDSLESCPTCKASQDGWKAAVLATLDRELGNATLSAENAKISFDAAKEQHEAAERALAHAEKLALAKRDLPSMQAALEAALALPRLQIDLEEARTLAAAAEEKHDRAADAVSDADAEAKELWERRRDLSDVDELRTKAASGPPEPDITAALDAEVGLEEAVEALEQKLDDLTAAATAAAASTTRRAEAEKALQAANEAEAKLAEAKEREKAWRAIIEDTMTEAFSVVTNATNMVAEGIMRGKLLAVDGDVGLIRGDAFVPFDAMAGLEQMMVIIGLQIGLQTGERIVIVDELGRLTPDHKARLRETLWKLMDEGEIEQVILVDPNANDWADCHLLLIDSQA